MPRRGGRRRGVVTGHVDGVTGGRNLLRAPPSDTRDAAAATEKRRRSPYEAEVRQLNVKIIERRLEQQVLRLEVAVHDASMMQVRQRI